MANNSGGNSGLAFIVGALLVAVLVLGYFVMGGDAPQPDNSIIIELPDVDVNN
jgi:hypothetical protein